MPTPKADKLLLESAETTVRESSQDFVRQSNQGPTDCQRLIIHSPHNMKHTNVATNTFGLFNPQSVSYVVRKLTASRILITRYTIYATSTPEWHCKTR